MKGKFKFTSVKKDEKSQEKKEVNQLDSEVFNINELQKYYAEFSEKSKSNKLK